MAPDLREFRREEVEECPRANRTSPAGCDGENRVFIPHAGRGRTMTAPSAAEALFRGLQDVDQQRRCCNERGGHDGDADRRSQDDCAPSTPAPQANPDDEQTGGRARRDRHTTL